MRFPKEPVEEPYMPCPEVIAELNVILEALPGLEQSTPQTKGWFKTIYDARKALLEPYFLQVESYKHHLECKRITQEKRKATIAAKNAKNAEVSKCQN